MTTLTRRQTVNGVQWSRCLVWHITWDNTYTLCDQRLDEHTSFTIREPANPDDLTCKRCRLEAYKSGCAGYDEPPLPPRRRA